MTADTKCATHLNINMPNNISVPSNTAFDITDITVPVSWYTVDAGRNDTIYVWINDTDYAPSTCTLPERSYGTTTQAASVCKVMNSHYPIAPEDGTHPQKRVPQANLVNHTISIHNKSRPFELLTNEQVVALMYMEWYTAQIPVSSIDDMLHNAVRQPIPTSVYFTSSYVDIHPIRNLYQIYNTFWELITLWA